MSELTQIQQQISFGLDVQAFMQSDMGKYLTDRANNDREAALEALKSADAEDPKAIRKLQNNAICAENFLLWMGEAVAEGMNAERAFIEVTD